VIGRLFANKHERSEHQPFDEIAPPSSGALTRWLRQGLELGICPLCRVSHKADREYIWQFSEEGFGDAETMAQLAGAHGFCSAHAAMLEAIDVEMRSMLGVSTVYAELFGDLLAELQRLDPSEKIADEPCPACANRDRAVAQNGRYLLGMLGERGAFADRFRSSSSGLCFGHFELVWKIGGSAPARTLLLDVQRQAVAAIDADLREFMRKEGVEARHEPKGTEQDAWRRAMHLTAGWPAPSASAGVPEQDGPRSC
jgi:hypothetical protein